MGSYGAARGTIKRVLAMGLIMGCALMAGCKKKVPNTGAGQAQGVPAHNSAQAPSQGPSPQSTALRHLGGQAPNVQKDLKTNNISPVNAASGLTAAEQTPAATPPATPAPETETLVRGTTLAVQFMTAVSASMNRVGDVCNGVLDEPVEVNGHVVFVKGTAVTATVVKAQRPAAATQSGVLGVEVTVVGGAEVKTREYDPLPTRAGSPAPEAGAPPTTAADRAIHAQEVVDFRLTTPVTLTR